MMNNNKSNTHIDGFLLIDKPKGKTSQWVVHQIKKTLQLTKKNKIGHTGTLDPFATGLLPIAIGHGTKFCEDLLMQNKTYHATLKLGFSSNTGDSEGIISEADQNLTEQLNQLNHDVINNALCSFLGETEQIPPMYSALKQNGIRLYDLARQGIEVERPKRKIIIYQITLLSFDLEHKTIDFSVHCSSGTYVRTLGEDIAKKLGTHGYLTELRRISVGEWHLNDAITLEGLKEHNHKLISLDNPLQHFPKFILSLDDKIRFFKGQRFYFPELVDVSENGLTYRIYAQDEFIGLAWIEKGRIQPKKVLGV